MSPVAAVLGAAVTAYQWTVRPLLGCNCRFHPGCSDYALAALRSHGALRGTVLARGASCAAIPGTRAASTPSPHA